MQSVSVFPPHALPFLKFALLKFKIMPLRGSSSCPALTRHKWLQLRPLQGAKLSRLSSSARWRHRRLTQVKAPPLLLCFDVDCHGDNRNPPPSTRPRSHTQLPLPADPNTAMFSGQGVGQRGGRDGRWRMGGGGVVEIQESPRQRVRDTKGTKDGFNHRRNVFPADIM